MAAGRECGEGRLNQRPTGVGGHRQVLEVRHGWQ